MGTNYLKKYYLEDHKLAQRARLEFYRALSTGRMIAFTGSMATQAFGYGSWQQLRMSLSALAYEAVATPDARDQIRKFDACSADVSWSPTVGMSLIEETLERTARNFSLPDEQRQQLKSPSEWPLDQISTVRELVRARLAHRFRQPRPSWAIDRTSLGGGDFNRLFNVPLALWKDLGIRRFATPSYDFEIERVAMLPASKSDASPFEELMNLRSSADENFSWDLGSGRIRRVFPDGWAIESDLLNRERIDRMIEFAVGTDDVDGHIMHLHGRACNWHSMIATQRDYDNLYRRNDLNRGPFEFAKRLMMGGNPILFVGLGMGEAELNHDLQEFISNNPYQRVAPTFLLWSARPQQLNADQRAAKRLDYLRRLGVLTIFDTDFGPVRDPDYKMSEARERNKTIEARFKDNMATATIDAEGAFDEADVFNRAELKDLKECVDRLANGVAKPSRVPTAPNVLANPTLRETYIGNRWRSMEGRVRIAAEQKAAVKLWNSHLSVDHFPEELRKPIKAIARASKDNPMLCIIGSQGCGRGTAARALSGLSPKKLGLQAPDHCLLINGCFSFDTDTLLDGVSRSFSHTFGKPVSGINGEPLQCRSSFFGDLKLYEGVEKGERTSLVIINGFERFFDIAGEPLSAELDELLAHARGPRPKGESKKQTDQDKKRKIRRPRVRWVIFGTERVRNYMKRIGADVRDWHEFVGGANAQLSGDTIPSQYLNTLWQETTAANPLMTLSPPLHREILRFEANRSGRISGDSMSLRIAFFGTVLHEDVFANLITANGGGKVVNTRTAKEILKALAFTGIPIEEEVLQLMPLIEHQVAFSETLEALVRAKLVLKLDGYREPKVASRDPAERYALHRSLLTELRFRYGIPLSEAKLSTAFNMSLYVAQPLDGDIPDTDIHDDLGNAIDRLIGSYRTGKETDLADVAAGLGLSCDDYRTILEDVAVACGASAQPPYAKDKEYLDIHRLCSGRHVRALRTALGLVRSYYSTTGLLTLDSGDRLIREGSDGVLQEHAERLDDLIDAYGKLSLARTALRNRLGDKLFHPAFEGAEPFYADELVWLHNERGVARLAMGDLYEARRSFDQALLVNSAWVELNERAHNWRRIRINQLTVDIEMGQISTAERKCAEILDVSSKGFNLREDELARALATGFRAWCLHLRGQTEQALADYDKASKLLSGLHEVRAQAFFERLHANALGASNRADDRLARLEYALGLAQSAVQMDIVHRLQITLAETQLGSDDTLMPGKNHRAYRYLEDALTYALHTDIHRVRCEASTVTAKARLGMSDFDGALRYATDAMMVATRYGLELRKIALRALIAQIMAARGHPVTADHLARTCIKMATRQRYQTAIDEASRVITDIPRISAAISTSDKSGRRNF